MKGTVIAPSVKSGLVQKISIAHIVTRVLLRYPHACLVNNLRHLNIIINEFRMEELMFIARNVKDA